MIATIAAAPPPRFPQLILPNRRLTRISAVHADGRAATARATAASLYDALGVHSAASAAEIKAAYRRLARTCHPDAGAPAEEFMRIHAAYTTLSDPEKRADHDRALFGPSRIRPASPGGFGVGRRRTWETDQCW